MNPTEYMEPVIIGELDIIITRNSRKDIHAKKCAFLRFY